MQALAQLYYHLEFNHYPPIDRIFAEAAIEALANVVDGQTEEPVLLPNGLIMDSIDIFNELHLGPFIHAIDELL